MKALRIASTISLEIWNAHEPKKTLFALSFGARPMGIELAIGLRVWKNLLEALRRNCRREGGRYVPILVRHEGASAYGPDINLKTGRLTWRLRWRAEGEPSEADVERQIQRASYALICCRPIFLYAYEGMYEALSHACLTADDAYRRNVRVRPLKAGERQEPRRVRDCDYVQLVVNGALLLWPDHGFLDFHRDRVNAELWISSAPRRV